MPLENRRVEVNLASHIVMKGGSLTTYRKRGRQKGFSVSVNTNKSFLCTCFTPMVLQLEKRAHFQTEILRCIQFVREPDGEGVSLSWSTVAMHQVPTKPQIPKQVVIDELPPPCMSITFGSSGTNLHESYRTLSLRVLHLQSVGMRAQPAYAV